MLEECVDYPSINVNDIGEQVSEIPNTIIDDEIYDAGIMD